MTNENIQVGDIFAIAVDDGREGYGQVTDVLASELYIVIFDCIRPTSNRAELGEVVSARIVFSSLSLDAKLFHCHWTVIGNWTDNLSGVPRPIHKIRQDGKYYLETIDGRFVGEASAEAVDALRFRKTVAPVRLEKAIRAYYGVGDWDSDYDGLKHEYAESSSKMASL